MTRASVVTWQVRGHKVYYSGWWHTYGEPLYSPNPKDAKRMTRNGANRVRRRMENPAVWGGGPYTVETI